MSDRKLAKAVQELLRQIQKLARTISKGFVTWLLRVALVANRRNRRAIAGFVLPTTVFLILVVALTAGALSYRAFTTSTRSISDAQNRIIYNAATPAVDRARAKLEFMFNSQRDNRLPSGVPSEEFLLSMMLNDESSIKNGKPAPKLTYGGEDPYVLKDETRIDINNDGQKDNAWVYRQQIGQESGSPQFATVVYSITFSTPEKVGAEEGWQRLLQMDDKTKVAGETDSSSGRKIIFSRTGPLSNATGKICGTQTGKQVASKVEGGWYDDKTNTAILRKNYQVDAFVIPDNIVTGSGNERNFTTLEFQQDRQLDKGNKWGAWFRTDLEIFPGPQFNWNGAMHTEGSLFIGKNNFSAYLISSPASCLFYESASEISVTNTKDSETNSNFFGLIASGNLRDNQYEGQSEIHLFRPSGYAKQSMTQGNDWASGGSPLDLSLDPTILQTRNGYASRGGDVTNSSLRQTNTTFQGRFLDKAEPAPYVDDTYRADNRYGPKQRYNSSITIPTGKKVGDLIQTSDFTAPEDASKFKDLTGDEKPAGTDDNSAVGLDGYWERRARNEGLRILVGQRLELGNSNGWVTPQDRPNDNRQPLDDAVVAGDGDYIDLRTANGVDSTQGIPDPTNPTSANPDISDNEGDPLYPPPGYAGSPALTHEAIQRRALRDNIAAVQSTAVYHYAINKDFPAACLATTAHPGSPTTLQQSINFVPSYFKEKGTATDQVLMTDFFTGRGTNGWEFEPPMKDAASFATTVDTPTSPLRIALENLAHFAGDHISDSQTGAFPPTQVAGAIHPDPEFAMWGNFSQLRRTLASLTSVGYANLSPADKTYLQTAACTLGMLAYNIDQVQKFDPSNPNNETASGSILYSLGGDMAKLMDGIVDETASNFEVLPKQQLATYSYSSTGTYASGNYTPRDYDRVPAEAFLGKLRESYISQGTSLNTAKMRMAELLLNYFQIQRDRAYGFRSSPAANTWNYNPYIAVVSGKATLWSSACDPNTFALKGAALALDAASLSGDPNQVQRLGLSRLCGTVIPPGATREYPGDLQYPARNRDDLATLYLPVDPANPAKAKPPLQETLPLLAEVGAGGLPEPNPDPSSGVTGPENQYFWKTQAYFDSKLKDAPTSLDFGKKLNAQDTFSTPDYIPYTTEPYLRATVQPKWPSLYYLFPVAQHDHDGELQPLPSGFCYDHRQPTGDLKVVDANCAEGAVMLAAFQPWAEPYITDAYTKLSNNGFQYKPVDSSAPQNNSVLDYDVPGITVTAGTDTYSYRYKTFNFRIDTTQSSVAGLATLPRKLPSTAGITNPPPLAASTASDWVLPISRPSAETGAQYTPVNRIKAPNGSGTRNATAVIPFLDRVAFDGREWMPLRLLDLDIGLMRRKFAATSSTGDPENWLPNSGIIYAFREDAVREDAINRPPGAATTPPAAPTQTNATSSTPANQVDPPVDSKFGVSLKPVDFVPDPERRPYGFRLRDASVLKRAGSIPDEKNTFGMSFFTDDPVYIMGYYNLHQPDENSAASSTSPRLEEFKEQLPSTGPYNETQFYGDRKTLDTRFADPKQDLWRPSEILADSVNILSSSFCDGGILDTFMTAGVDSPTISDNTYSGRNTTASGTDLDSNTRLRRLRPYTRKPNLPAASVGAGIYHDPATNGGLGLYAPGCTNGGSTSFLNQNRPRNITLLGDPNSLSTAATLWNWARENPADIFSPVRVSRNGAGVVIPPSTATPSSMGFSAAEQAAKRSANQPEVTSGYDQIITSNNYYSMVIDPSKGRKLQAADPTRVNSIVISGVVPSRRDQYNGGMHNFPRLLEDWRTSNGKNGKLWFAGSFLQLNFSNYATAPFDITSWEPGATPSGKDKNKYYEPPERLWGYDVALQLSPAGPAASRFVTAGKQRNEFYTEVPANDPYMNVLCEAAKKNPVAGTPPVTGTPAGIANLSCPS